jgi:hypothetical protein
VMVEEGDLGETGRELAAKWGWSGKEEHLYKRDTWI